MKDTSREGFDWMSVVGALVVIALVISLILRGLLGWNDFKAFLSGSASGWLQAIGSIGVILAGFVAIDRTDRAQRNRDVKAATELHRRQYQAVLAACMQADEAVAWANVGAVEGPNDVDSLLIAVGEALAAFKSISFEQIPDGELLMRSGALRKDLVTLLIHCRAAASKPAMRSHEFLTSFLPAFIANVDSVKNRASRLREQE